MATLVSRTSELLAEVPTILYFLKQTVPEPQGRVARARMTEVSGLLQFVKYLMASTWDYSRLLELDGPQARDAVPQLAAQLVDVPNVDIPALQVVEDAEEVVCSQHSLLLRFRDGEWKERGRSGGKLLVHRKTGKVRFVLRQEETMNIVSNFDVSDVLSHTEHVPNADLNAWCWQAIDCSEGEPKAVQMALISVSTVLAMKFKNEFVSQATDRGGDLLVACATDHCCIGTPWPC